MFEEEEKTADEETLPDTPLHAYGEGREEDVEGDVEKLKALLRQLYGTLGWHPWARGPHPWAGRRGTDRARRLQRTTRAGIQR